MHAKTYIVKNINLKSDDNLFFINTIVQQYKYKILVI